MQLSSFRVRAIYAAPFAALAGLLIFSPSDDGPTVCPFALCTGHACPGCGMTRAAAALVRGDLTSAFSYHPLVPLVLAQLGGAWVWFALRRRGIVEPLSPRTLNIVLGATIVALVAVWVARLLSGTLPPV